MDHSPLSDVRKEDAKGVQSALAYLSAGGEMGKVVREKDWSKTPLGPIDSWPQSLRTALGMVLSSRYPMFIAWGDSLTFLYNDGYAPILGSKHPAALGRPFADVWAEIWKDICPLVGQALAGKATWSEDLLLFMERNGYTEETYYTFSYSPVPEESGGVGGMLCACTETTHRVIGDRRLALLREIGIRMLDVRTWQESATRGIEALDNARDIPFALLYLAERGSDHLTLAGASGIKAGHDAAPEILRPDDPPWKLRVARHQREPVRVELSGLYADQLPTGLWDRAPVQAALLPVSAGGQTGRGGILIVGLNPYRLFDEHYRNFLMLVAGQLSSGIATAQAYEEEKKRAETLAELDRAKTVFFSNVSHEFRTPLTLMLSPLEELKAQVGRSTSSLDVSHYQQVDLIHRNGLRLLKLVNTLLDFSRIEAGRAQAVYEETDLATLTADLASAFRSTIEKAGLSLIVNCQSLPEPAFVDRDMWEKIVLNLISNAFKFTFVGEIEVALRPAGQHVELSVRDTGTGIPEDQLGRIFERFHRVAGSQGRTYEGTGIGLSLVQELARLHGGSISAESVYGKGSTFRVRIPLGKSHLPHGHIGVTQHRTATTLGATPFVEEASRWLHYDERSQSQALSEDLPINSDSPNLLRTPALGTRARVLLADDNADMREYLRRLLSSQGYEVDAVADGQAAFDRVHASPPDLVLSDVMMPRLDGFGLLHALRNDPATKTIPVILLSARAGEEARVEGLGAGADDYLIKPFHARELLARVETHVKMARTRREAQAALRESEGRFRTMADTAPAMLWVTEPNGSCSFLSRGWYEFTGQTEEEGLGKQGMGWLDATHPEDRDRSSRLFLDANENRRPFTLEYRLRHHDGEHRWAIDVGRPRFGPSGEFLGYIGSVLDITERKQAEEALRVSEEQTKRARDYAEATLRTSPVPLLVLGKDLRVSTANEAFYETFHVNAPETEGRLVYELGNGQWNIPKLRELLETLLPQHRQFKDFEVTHDFESIGVRTMLLNGRRMEDDTAQRIVLVIEDITERKRADEVLRKTQERFDIVRDASEVGFWFCDLPFADLIWDNRVKEHFWLPPDAPVTIETFYERLHPDDRARTKQAIEQSISNRTRYEIDYRTLSPEGKVKWIRAIGRTFYDQNQRPIRFDGVTLDITERKQAEDSLRQTLLKEESARQQADEAREALRRLNDELEQRVTERIQALAQSEDRLRSLATELNLAEQRERTRLATELHDYLAQLLVLGRLTLGQARRTGLSPAGENFIKETEEILNKALTYCRTLMAELNPPVLRDQGLAAGLKWLGEYMKKHQIAVTVTVPEKDELKLREDHAVLLFQSVRELLMNACKHAGTGEAAIVLEQSDSALRVTVSDHGAGFDMAPSVAGHASPLSSKYGLFSIRERMKALGGNFDIWSVRGHGTTATLTLPVTANPLGMSGEQKTGVAGQVSDTSRPTLITHHSPDQRNTIRVLLVDDHPMMREGLRTIVSAYDCLEVVGEAGDGAEAVDLAQRLNPDVVVMDINMPRMDGIEATQRIKANQPTTVVIGLSVNQSADTEHKMKAAGAATYLTKESAVDALCHAIEQAVSYNQPTVAPPVH